MEVRIENWELVAAPENPYQAPEIWPLRLQGEVYGHDRFEDGESITTSRIVHAEGKFVRTNNNEYILGEPSEKYAAWYKEKHGVELDADSPFPYNMED